MRRVIVWEMMTLDGYFEGPKPWEIDYHEYVWGPELERTLLFGRRTYEGMAAYSSAATGDIAEFMNSVPKVVFSNTLEAATWNDAPRETSTGYNMH